MKVSVLFGTVLVTFLVLISGVSAAVVSRDTLEPRFLIQPVTGTGASGVVPLWVGDRVIGESVLRQSGSRVGLNIVPLGTLHVFDPAGDSSLVLDAADDGAAHIRFVTYGVDDFTVDYLAGLGRLEFRRGGEPVLSLSDSAVDINRPLRANGGLAGRATCWKVDRSLGYCASGIGVDGSCLCR